MSTNKDDHNLPSFNLVNRHNLNALSLAIKLLIGKAHHIALDTEFTGLGDSKRTRAQ